MSAPENMHENSMRSARTLLRTYHTEGKNCPAAKLLARDEHITEDSQSWFMSLNAIRIDCPIIARET